MSKRKGPSSAWKEQIESTLQRIHRQSAAVARPPDEASATIGRGLAERLLGGIDHQNALEVADLILSCLIENKTSPSVPESFFQTLASEPRQELLDWIPQCILQAEEQSSSTVLYCAISTYAKYCCTLENVKLASISHLYSRLKLASSRMCMSREFLQNAHNTTLLSPLMASCVIHLASPWEEKMVFLQGTWRRGWLLVESDDKSETLGYLQWMTESLHMFLNGIPNQGREGQTMSMELAYQWLTEISNMVGAISIERDEAPVFALLHSIFNKILPHFFVTKSRFSMATILESLNAVCRELKTSVFNRSTCFRLANLALATAIKKDASCLLKLLTILSKRSNDEMVQGLMYSMACIFANDKEFKGVTEQMLHQVSDMSTTNGQQCGLDADLTSIVQLFCPGKDTENLLTFMTGSLQHIDPLQVALLDQVSALSLGCSLLFSKSVETDQVYSYLRAIVQQFPHLGTFLLPILFQSIEKACTDNDGIDLLHQLGFLCGALVQDPSCAQEVWNLVGVTMSAPDSPTSVRSTAIRMFPKLVTTNKKLYRRVIDTLGRLVNSKEPEIRVAVVATINDLAREDRIRDVADVIGWIQSFLSDEDPSVKHYAILSLHHLVIAGELDFDLVIKVLKKRLCPIGDVEMILALPASVLESLVLLLGDGECSDTDSDEEVAIASSELGVSPQVSDAVSTLILLGNSDLLSPKGQSSLDNEIIYHIRCNICKSLSSYSLLALGLDEEGVQSVTIVNQKFETDRVALSDAGLRYSELKRFAADEIQYAPQTLKVTETDSTVSLIRKMVSLEEEALGSSLWQKRGKTRVPNKPERTSAPKAAFSVLPAPKLIRECYDDDPSFSSSVAALLCYSGSSIDDLFSFASDISAGLHDPFSLIYILAGWLRAMRTMWAGIMSSNDSSKLEATTSLVTDVNGWRDLLDTADLSYLALASFSICVPNVLRDIDGGSSVDFSPIIDEIGNDMHRGYNGHLFENRDIADLCLAMAGSRAIHSRRNEFVGKCITMLKKSISEHSDQSSFGATYGLALITQAVASVSDETADSISGGSPEQIPWIGDIASLLVQELLSCLETSDQVPITFVACLKSGKLTPDLLSSLSSLTCELKVHGARLQKARCLLLSLALCVQPVSIVNADLLPCLLKFTEKLEWGVGKGFVVPNVVSHCLSAGKLIQDEADGIIEEYKGLVDDFLRKAESNGLSDVLYAYVSLKVYSSPQGGTTEDFMLINRILESYVVNEECYSSLLLSATMLVSTFPNFASGGRMFCSVASLHPRVTKELVSDIVLFLTDVAEGRRRLTNSRSTARQLLGLLASIKDGHSKVVPESVFGSSVASSTGPKKPTEDKVCMDNLPVAHDETLLQALMVCLREVWGRVNSKTAGASADLVRLLACLETLSLPSEFARLFVEPILSTGIEEVKPACVSLLISQVSGRRRAAFDGRDFFKLTNRIALLDPSSFRSIMGNGSGPGIFISALHTYLPRLPSENTESILTSLWESCEEGIDTKTADSCAVGYLSSLSSLLETRHKKEALRLSPRTYTLIVQVLLRPVFSTFSKLASGGTEETHAAMHSIEKSYIDCLTQIDAAVLEENQMLVLSSDDYHMDLSRAIYIVDLLSRHYFEEQGRSSKELLKVIAWFANQRSSPSNNEASLRQLAVRITIAATMTESSESKKDSMSLLFEALLVRGPVTCCLELMGMLASTWTNRCNAESSSSELYFRGTRGDSLLLPTLMKDVSNLLLKDLPFNIGAYGRSAKVQGLIANSVLRIFKTWSEQGVSEEELALIENILVCCRTLEHNKEEDLASLVVSRLSTLQSATTTVFTQD